MTKNLMKTYWLAPGLVADLDTTKNRSKAIVDAVVHAADNPHVLVDALGHRLNQPFEDNSVQVAIRVDAQYLSALEGLGQRSKLQAEQVVRLCAEAHVLKLRNQPGKEL